MKPLDLQERLKRLLLDEKHTDCSFRINSTILHAHKVILSAASPVFEAMFYGFIAEKNVIDIQDINSDIFQAMLVFIYTDEIDTEMINIESLMELYYCAEKYLIENLLKQCVELIKKSLQHSNILQALDLAVYFRIVELQKICLNYFQKYCLSGINLVTTIFNSNVHISKECLNYILKCNIKEQNINLVHLIRGWCKIEAKYLGMDDEHDLQFILNGVDVPDDLFDDIKNNRSIISTENSLKDSQRSWILCQRLYYKAIRPLRLDQNLCFKTTLTSNRFIVLRSLIINSRLMPSTKNCPKNYCENVQVKITDNEFMCILQKFVICNVEYNLNVYLVFDKPVMLRKEVPYTIEFNWDNNCCDFEYPRNVFSQIERNTLCSLSFDEDIDTRLYYEHGSILSGLEYIILD